MTMKTPLHPGRIVASSIEDLELSVAQGAAALGVTRAQLYRVIKGGSAVSPEMALRLETVIGSTAEAWLRMQAAFDAAHVRDRAADITKGLKRVEAKATPRPEQPSLL